LASSQSTRTAVALLLVVGALYFSSGSFARWSDQGVTLACLLLAIPLLWTLFWRAKVRRRAFRDFYLHADSGWHRWIRGGVVMLGTRALVALGLALLLVIGLARTESRVFWGALVFAALTWMSSHGVLARRVATQAHPRFHRLLATRLHGYAWFGGLLLLLCGLAFFEPVPDVRGLTLDEAVLRFTQGYPAASRLLDWGLVATEALRAIPHWLMQNLGQDLPGRLLGLLAWSLVLAREWVFAWPLVLLFQAVQDALDGGVGARLEEMG
jgi:hypothetical protein